jgi:hypothetical protein
LRSYSEPVCHRKRKSKFATRALNVGFVDISALVRCGTSQNNYVCFRNSTQVTCSRRAAPAQGLLMAHRDMTMVQRNGSVCQQRTSQAM